MMKHISFSIVSTLLLVFSAGANEWTFDKAHTNIKFKVKHLAVANVWGEFTSFDGQVFYDKNKPESSRVFVKINAASVDTENKKRDDHLRSSDFFEVNKYPQMMFSSKQVIKEKSGIKIIGDLTIKDIKKEVILRVAGPTKPIIFMGTTKIAASATTRINRINYGLTWNRALETGGVLVGKKVDIIIDVELDKKE